MIIFIK